MNSYAGIFDKCALNYDREFTSSITGKGQRNVVWRCVKNLLMKKNIRTVVELNCGTGEDAIWLANQNIQVLATDASKVMIEEADKKLMFRSRQMQPEFRQMTFAQAAEQMQPGCCDMVFSNFGGLNCIPANELRSLSAAMHHWLNPGGVAMLVFIGKKCAWEQWYFLSRMKFRSVFRRSSGYAEVKLDEHHVQPTWYFSPDELMDIFGAEFKVRALRPVGLWVPPSWMEAWARRNRGRMERFEKRDIRAAEKGRWSSWSDHILIELEKK